MLELSRLPAKLLCPSQQIAARVRRVAGSVAPSTHVKAMELALVFNHKDYAHFVAKGGNALGADLPCGYAFSGSTAGRNIELIYQKAEAAGEKASLQGTVEACLGSGKVQHVLLCSGFYVLHGRGGTPAFGIAPGSCETDGPLGVLALLRAFALRGVRASLFCDAHNGPVLRAGYEAMLEYFRAMDGDIAHELEMNSRCLPFVSDAISPNSSTSRRCEHVAAQLGDGVREAWTGMDVGQIDCLFALERLGAPYRNIRGRDLSEHTVPVDALWPTLKAHPGLAEGSIEKLTAWAAENPTASTTTMLRLRRAAGINEDALTVAVGDGGNEVGLGKVAHLRGLAELSPGGDFVSLAENGCFRTCDHLILSTVSNWAGTAFEAAANILFKPQVEYVKALQANGKTMSDLEAHLLSAIMSPPTVAVDGIDSSREFSVDGMAFEPCHRDLYDMLWSLNEAGLRARTVTS